MEAPDGLHVAAERLLTGEPSIVKATEQSVENCQFPETGKGHAMHLSA